MSTRPSLSEWLSDRLGLAVLTLVSVLLALLIILPYLQYVLLGVILAYILMPAQRRLENYMRSMTAALVLVVVAILAILLPVMYVLAIAFGQALEVAMAIQDGTLNVEDIEQRIAETGYTVDLQDTYSTYQEPIATGLQGLATGAIEFVGGVPAILIGLTVTVFVLFALLRDGDRLVSWVGYVVPIEDQVQRELFSELDQLMWASVVGNVAVAIIQALLLGVGLALLGVPAVVLLTVGAFVAALLPLIGVFAVWMPISLYLLAVGQFVPAAILVVYGLLVSASDTYLRPALIGRTSAFNSAIIVVGIFGGLVVFGAVGLFIGPVVLGGAKITLDLFAREWSTSQGDARDEPESAADPAAETAEETGITDDSEVGPPETAGEQTTKASTGVDGANAGGEDAETDEEATDTDGAPSVERVDSTESEATGSDTGTDSPQ
ncbi:AI-2E family transporter [Natronococcus pandeyae]|uniref:AI-2E family transporter n=1 Tax=Natronococcus pandeyae TaxID=2055836 RepID=A0A8J8PZ73_9EURY|nr:AI-2E family transporter [Natronococcus pandeyae]TYL36102.1 AI-2E family transporter [Natronococcus pandeyae]